MESENTPDRASAAGAESPEEGAAAMSDAEDATVEEDSEDSDES